jgi:hypothetical protein
MKPCIGRPDRRQLAGDQVGQALVVEGLVDVTGCIQQSPGNSAGGY